MDNIIFITDDLRKTLLASGLSLDCLRQETINDHLSREDQYIIDYMTTKAREEQGILAYYGFGFSNSNDALQSTNRLIVPKPSLDEYVTRLENRTRPLNAYCPDEKTIILWQPDELAESVQKTHSMFKVNLREILKAMARVLSLKAVLGSSQLELAVLRD